MALAGVVLGPGILKAGPSPKVKPSEAIQVRLSWAVAGLAICSASSEVEQPDVAPNTPRSVIGHQGEPERHSFRKSFHRRCGLLEVSEESASVCRDGHHADFMCVSNRSRSRGLGQNRAMLKWVG
jgi:hypothetical protein